MLSLNDYMNEALITLGGKAKHNFGQIVILAGGAGSGKGFQLDKLLGIQGKVLDVDRMKQLAIDSTKFAARVSKDTGTDIKNLKLKKPEDVAKLHQLTTGIISKSKDVLFNSIAQAHPHRKPNLIFDVTLKDVKKLHTILSDVMRLGYTPESVHLVWIVNDIDIAKVQNSQRDRVVPSDILMDTHKGAALTMKSLLDGSLDVSKALNGDIWLTFNKFVMPGHKDNDTELEMSKNHDEELEVIKNKGRKAGAKFVVKKGNYVRIKQSGQRAINWDNISKELLHKINAYVPVDF